MKYIKKYENMNDLQVGNYVIVNNTIEEDKSFFESNIGKIVKVDRDYSGGKIYGVEYENLPKHIKNAYCSWRQRNGKQYLENFIWFSTKMIKYAATNKEDLKLYISMGKYNI